MDYKPLIVLAQGRGGGGERRRGALLVAATLMQARQLQKSTGRKLYMTLRASCYSILHTYGLTLYAVYKSTEQTLLSHSASKTAITQA